MEKLLLTSGNPEVVLSYLDLCAEALTADDAAIGAVERTAVGEFKNIRDGDAATAFAEERGEYIDTLYNDLKRQPLDSAVRARLGFVAGLGCLSGTHALAGRSAGGKSSTGVSAS